MSSNLPSGQLTGHLQHILVTESYSHLPCWPGLRAFRCTHQPLPILKWETRMENIGFRKKTSLSGHPWAFTTHILGQEHSFLRAATHREWCALSQSLWVKEEQHGKAMYLSEVMHQLITGSGEAPYPLQRPLCRVPHCFPWQKPGLNQSFAYPPCCRCLQAFLPTLQQGTCPRRLFTHSSTSELSNTPLNPKFPPQAVSMRQKVRSEPTRSLGGTRSTHSNTEWVLAQSLPPQAFPYIRQWLHQISQQ